MLGSFLDFYRATLRRQCEGLSAAQLSQRLEPSTLTLGGLLKHLAVVEDWWFSIVLTGGEASSWHAGVDWDADEDWDFTSASSDSPEQLLRWYDDAVAGSRERVARALEAGTLDQLAALPRRGGAHPSLRWIVVHMIEEYARHAGHADLIRESVDGAVDL